MGMAETQMRNPTGALAVKFETGSSPRLLDVGRVLMHSSFPGVLPLQALKVFPAGAPHSRHISRKQSYMAQNSNNRVWKLSKCRQEFNLATGAVRPAAMSVHSYQGLLKLRATERKVLQQSLKVEVLLHPYRNQHRATGALTPKTPATSSSDTSLVSGPFNRLVTA